MKIHSDVILRLSSIQVFHINFCLNINSVNSPEYLRFNENENV